MVVQPEFRRTTLPALFRRRRQGYEPIARQEEHDEAALFEDDHLGQEPEARGDRLMTRGHRRGSSWWFFSCMRHKSFAIADDFREAALSYVLARNWRKAAAAYENQAVYALKGGLTHDAASALFISARCYRKTVHKDERDVAAIRSALLKAAELYIKMNELQSAFTCFLVLADFCAEQEEWHNALHLFEKAKDYYGNAQDSNPHYARHASYCNGRANLIRAILITTQLDARA